jgi:hypothetical protein
VVDRSVFQPGLHVLDQIRVDLILLGQHSYQENLKTYDPHLQKHIETRLDSFYTIAKVTVGCHLVYGTVSWRSAIRLHGVCESAENVVVQITSPYSTSEKVRVDFFKEGIGGVEYLGVGDRWERRVLTKRDRRNLWFQPQWHNQFHHGLQL